MASDDLDPIFVKALKLLLSKSKDSIEQLKHLADEFIEQRKKEVAIEIVRQAADADESNSYGFVGNSSVPKKILQEVEIKKEREVERENLEKLQGSTDSLSEDNPFKKRKLELGSGSAVSTSASLQSAFGKEKERGQGLKIKTESGEKPREKRYEIEEDVLFDLLASSLASNKRHIVVNSEKDERVRDRAKELECSEELNTSFVSVDGGSDTEVSGDELRKDGLKNMQCAQELTYHSCIVCRTFDISSTNRLIECQECHSFYHQECHKPRVTENVNDPRFVWYCNNCAKILKKTVTKSITKVKHPLPLNVRESPACKTSKIDTRERQPFRRFEQFLTFSELKDNRKNSITSGKGSGLSGLASVAASLSKSSSSSLNSSKMSKSDNFSHLTQLGSSDRSAFTFGTVDATGRFVESKGSSLKTISSNASASSTSHPFKSKQEKSSSSEGSQGWLKTQTKRSGLNAAPNISTSKMPQSNLMNAGKRLQMMKKQAAKMNRKIFK